MASRITSFTIVYSTIYSGADQRKHQTPASLAFVTGEFPAQMAGNAENVSIWWRHHDEKSRSYLAEIPRNLVVTRPEKCGCHYNDVIMGAIASQITSLRIVFSIVYLDTDQRKHQSSASLAFVRGIHRRPVNSPHKWPETRKRFPFDDVIMAIQGTKYIILLITHFPVVISIIDSRLTRRPGGIIYRCLPACTNDSVKLLGMDNGRLAVVCTVMTDTDIQDMMFASSIKNKRYCDRCPGAVIHSVYCESI